MTKKPIVWLQMLAILAVPCGAATISLNSGNMTAAVLFAPDFSSFSDVDIRSDATFLVSDSGGPLGVFITSDLGVPSPNANLLLANPGITEGGILTFFPAAGTLSADKQTFTIPVVGTPLVTITDPAVKAGLGITAVQFLFSSIIATNPDGNLALYTFQAVEQATPPIPEPASVGLAAAGLLFVAMGVLRRRRR